MEPVWKAAEALKQYIISLNLSKDEKRLLLETLYNELRIMYLYEDLESGYKHIKGVDDELDRLTNALYNTMEELYEMKDELDLEEILEQIKNSWWASELNSHPLS